MSIDCEQGRNGRKEEGEKKEARFSPMAVVNGKRKKKKDASQFKTAIGR